jgi:hypothetical protein
VMVTLRASGDRRTLLARERRRIAQRRRERLRPAPARRNLLTDRTGRACDSSAAAARIRDRHQRCRVRLDRPIPIYDNQTVKTR